MIVRKWHGRTKNKDAYGYRDYVMETGIKNLISTNGNIGAQIWQQQDGDITHIWVVSWWNSLESIKAFAGEDITIARYYDADPDYLLELERNVKHYECYDFSK